MKNNSYVCIPADKLAELIQEMCPPLQDTTCVGEHGLYCVACWRAWLKDGEQE